MAATRISTEQLVGIVQDTLQVHTEHESRLGKMTVSEAKDSVRATLKEHGLPSSTIPARLLTAIATMIMNVNNRAVELETPLSIDTIADVAKDIGTEALR